MATILITGANRGLGLEFAKQYAQDGWQVLACCREPKTATDLTQLANQFENLSVLALDVSDLTQIDALAKQLGDTAIDVLLANAGVYGDEAGHGFGKLDYAQWQKNMTINVFAPVKLAEVFLPNLQRGTQKKVIAMSSLMGSMADNGSGGSILYRSSKAALNAAMKSVAIDNRQKDIAVLILHPGWVKTDMGGSNAPMEIPDSVQKMRDTIANFTLAQSGEFLRYDGATLPW
ncbi:MAG: SDR family oxidoreductase [Methylococcales bacterium]|nr:SDR family oxidoreductase [Methylococcales bacterium]